MRILVYPHAMELGGSQLNAIELAAQYQRYGHEVILFHPPGTLAERARELGLECIEVPPGRSNPSLGTARRLRALIRERRVTAIHAFEWPPILTAWAAAGTSRGTAVLGTVMSMSVAPMIPRDVPLTVGTGDIAAAARAMGFRDVSLLEPPIDTDANSPQALLNPDRRIPHPVPGVCDLVMVTRLVPDLKGAGLQEAITAVAELPATRLLIVGEGRLRPQLETLAAEVNQQTGREAVLLLGEFADPRPAYLRADVVLGMGGSALRGMAFAKPLVVAGEEGFWQLATPESAPGFARTGWYGVGPGGSGVSRLQGILAPLVVDPARREELGHFSREWVCEHYSLSAAGNTCLATFQRLAGQAPAGRRPSPALEVSAAATLVKYKVNRKLEKRRGGATVDDFNTVVRPSPPGAQTQEDPR